MIPQKFRNCIFTECIVDNSICPVRACGFLTQFVPCVTLRVMYDGENIPSNLAFVLWKGGVPRARWIHELAVICDCDSSRALDLLRGKAKPSHEEMELLSRATEVESSLLLYGRLLEGTDVFSENLKFLFSSVEHGGLKHLAETIEVGQATVYKWKGGSQLPSKSHLLGILSFFGLGPVTDLTSTPLFLSMDPIGARATREWLIDRIQNIDDDQLAEFFPALKKLLD